MYYVEQAPRINDKGNYVDFIATRSIFLTHLRQQLSKKPDGFMELRCNPSA